MQESFVIRYEFDSNEGFDLALVGSSFVGFDRVIKQILAYGGLLDKVEVRTTRVKQGSVEVFNTLVTLDPLFIQDPRQLIQLLNIAAPELIKGVNTFMATKDSLNEHYAKNPLDFQVHILVAAYVVKSMIIAGKTKQGDKAVLASTKATPHQVKRLKSMVKRGYFKKALQPITQGNVSKVEVTGLNTSRRDSVVISEENVGDFLPEDEMILPQFNNGDKVTLSGELQMLGSTHGDSMKIRVRDIDPDNNLLNATLAEGIDIVEYRELFKQAVYLKAEIRRKTMYKRPELVIEEMTSLQEKLKL